MIHNFIKKNKEVVTMLAVIILYYLLNNTYYIKEKFEDGVDSENINEPKKEESIAISTSNNDNMKLLSLSLSIYCFMAAIAGMSILRYILIISAYNKTSGSIKFGARNDLYSI
jgi:hypothetical protein